MKTFLKILTLFISIGAIGGAVMMWVDPTGVSWGGEAMLDLVLLAVNGLPQLLAAVMLFKKHPLAYWVTFACGIILMLWIALEWYVWGFVAISNIYFVLGLVEAVVAWRCQKKA